MNYHSYSILELNAIDFKFYNAEEEEDNLSLGVF